MELRPATDSDLLWMFETRNMSQVYQGFYQQKSPLSWHEHLGWWATRPSSWHSFIIYEQGERVGVINIGQTEHWSPELGWFIHPDYWNKGYVQKAIQLAFEWLKERGFKHCHTTIKWDNEASNHIAFKLGFIPNGQGREGEAWLTKDLTQNFLI